MCMPVAQSPLNAEGRAEQEVRGNLSVSISAKTIATAVVRAQKANAGGTPTPSPEDAAGNVWS